jgi:hypothetical protein
LANSLHKPYDVGWDDDGNFHADVYFSENLTITSGWFGEQRTVSACIRYTAAEDGPTMTSIARLDEPPYNRKADEQVTVP